MKIAIIGAKGQLGYNFKRYAPNYKKLEILSYDKDVIDITDRDKLDKVFKENEFDYVINCAAYTNVNEAEKRIELSLNVNSEGPKYLSVLSNKYNFKFIHFSTDYVFDGKKSSPYTEEDIVNPLNQYGKSKNYGEINVLENSNNAIIFRVSWLYSNYGNNFYNTILEKIKANTSLSIVDDQISTPTNANEISRFILELIQKGNIDELNGIYHLSNEGVASWYDFAFAINKFIAKNEKIRINPIKTNKYPSTVDRPLYTNLSNEKIYNQTGKRLKHWIGSMCDMIDEKS